MSPKRIVAVATSVEQRARQRAPLGRLSDHLVQPATVKRYQKAFRRRPLPENLWGAFVEYALQQQAWPLAVLLLVGFAAFLRTTEFLTLERWQLEFGTDRLLVRLPLTKSGKRKNNAEESVLIEERLVVKLLALLVARCQPDARIWPLSPALFRQRWAALCDFFQVSDHRLLPSSLRRGGATAHFVRHRSYDRVCHKGRWSHLATSRIYVNQAREFLQQQAFTPAALRLIHHYNGHLMLRLKRWRRQAGVLGRR